MTQLRHEHAWLDTVRRLADLYGWRRYHTHDSRKSEPGFPDLVLAGHGRVLFAELKTDTGRVTKDQYAWLHAIAECKAPPEAYLWRPRDRDLVLRALDPRRGEQLSI